MLQLEVGMDAQDDLLRLDCRMDKYLCSPCFAEEFVALQPPALRENSQKHMLLSVTACASMKNSDDLHRHRRPRRQILIV